MSLDVGFHVFEKKNGKLVSLEQSASDESIWSGSKHDLFWRWNWKGHSDFDALYSFSEDAPKIYTTPLFSKEPLEKEIKIKEDELTHILKPDSFEDFKKFMLKQCEEFEKGIRERKRDLVKSMSNYKSDIEELRELQMDCNEENEFAFDKWTQEIRDYKETISNLKDEFDTFDDNDDDSWAVNKVKSMLKSAEEYLNKGYLLTIYYSY